MDTEAEIRLIWERLEKLELAHGKPEPKPEPKKEDDK